MTAADATRPLLAWYGDDFTGSSAVMEVLEFAGVPSVLFTDIPNDSLLARFSDCRAIGIAGVARSQPPEWMQMRLPPIFRMLSDTGAELVHYKVCSTLDSSPTVGSIGKVADLAAPIVGGTWHPLLLAAPEIGRYQTWGNLFAVADGTVHRLDRHPTMSRHPVTPMTESDIRLHLAKQTDMAFGLVPLETLRDAKTADKALDDALAADGRIIAFDAVSNADMAEIGRLIWENRHDARFAIGSQGVEYALIEHWRRTGAIQPEAGVPSAGNRDVIAAVSGSVSPITADQLSCAQADGFDLIDFDAASVVQVATLAEAIEAATKRALSALERGASPLVHTARGPQDPAVSRFREAVDRSDLSLVKANARVGAALGEILTRILDRSDVVRVAISGGDTSGHAINRLGVKALKARAPISPGTGICQAFQDHGPRGDFEIALKGGQMGTPDYFGRIRSGGGAAHYGRTAA